MITLTSLQRHFLDRYYTELMDSEPGYACALAQKHGFTYEHMYKLWDAYHQSWGRDFGVWGADCPPLSPPPNPPIFPWPSIQALEEQLETEGVRLTVAPPQTAATSP
jgi:hypothetical protein